MEAGERVKKFRDIKKLSTNDLSRLTGISQSTISKLENGKRKVDLKILEKIAGALNVSVDRLTGESVSSIIEDRLQEKGMTLREVSEKSGVSLHWLANIDAWVPGVDGFGETNKKFDYYWITKVAEVLELPGSTLRAALARQEPPTYDGPVESAAEDFKTPLPEEDLKDNLEIYPIRELVKIPIIGTVSAGPNGLAYEDYQGEEWTDKDSVNGGKYFYLRVKGDSMLNEGILPGDLALVRETPEVNYGALAIAIVDNEEGMIKRVFKNEDNIILQSNNPNYPPRVFKKGEMSRVRLIGEVKRTIRQY